jgi:imidazoleglycerol-phosphate dehydratase
MAKREAVVERRTSETRIHLELQLETASTRTSGAPGPAAVPDISTGIGFFDHMLASLSKHANVALKVDAHGDLHVDGHHTVEDTGIAFGQALKQALGDKSGIRRFGSAYVPLDEALSLAVVDVSGRPFLVFEATFDGECTGGLETQLVEEFFRAVAVNAGITVHLQCLYGSNDHHRIESMFKAFARALREAVEMDPASDGIPSTKGVL